MNFDDMDNNFDFKLRKIVKDECCNVSMYNFKVNTKIINFLELLDSESLESLAFLNYCKKYVRDGQIVLSAKSILNLAVVFANSFDDINVKEENLKFYLSLIVMLSEESELEDFGSDALKGIGEIFFNDETIEFIMGLRERFRDGDIYLDEDYYEFLRDLIVSLECRYYICKKDKLPVPNVCDYVNKNNKNFGRILIRQ